MSPAAAPVSGPPPGPVAPAAAAVSFGWIATAANTLSYSAAHRADQRDDSRSTPTVMTRSIPAACAAASTPGTGSPMMSRCVWPSNSAGPGGDPPEPPATPRAVLARGDDPPEPPATPCAVLARGDDPP